MTIERKDPMKKYILPLLLLSTLSATDADAGKWGKFRKKVSDEVVKPVKKNIRDQLNDEGSTTQRAARNLKANIKHQLDDESSTLNGILTDLSTNLTHQVCDEDSTLNEALAKFEATADQLLANIKHQYQDDESSFHKMEAAVKQAVTKVRHQLLDENSTTRKTIDHLLNNEDDDGRSMQDIVRNALEEQIEQQED